MITSDDLKNWFQYHPPVGNQTETYEAIRVAGHAFASVILAQTPAGPDQTDAIRKIREAVMTANAAVACHLPDYGSGQLMAMTPDASWNQKAEQPSAEEALRRLKR